MSRSYKKHTHCTSTAGKTTKRQANKKVRRLAKDINKELFNGNHYKSLTESWDIKDYSWYKSERQALQEYENDFAMGIAYWTKDEAMKDWAKCYKRK